MEAVAAVNDITTPAMPYTRREAALRDLYEAIETMCESIGVLDEEELAEGSSTYTYLFLNRARKLTTKAKTYKRVGDQCEVLLEVIEEIGHALRHTQDEMERQGV